MVDERADCLIPPSLREVQEGALDQLVGQSRRYRPFAHHTHGPRRKTVAFLLLEWVLAHDATIHERPNESLECVESLISSAQSLAMCGKFPILPARRWIREEFEIYVRELSIFQHAADCAFQEVFQFSPSHASLFAQGIFSVLQWDNPISARWRRETAEKRSIVDRPL